MLQRHGPRIDVVVQREGRSVHHLPLRPIKHFVQLHVVNGAACSIVSSLPPLLHGLYYSQAQQLADTPHTTNIVVKSHQPAILYVLWPMLQVHWSFEFKQRVYLNLANLRKAYQQQSMLVWRLRKTLKAGAELKLPAPLPPDSNSSMPWFSYVVCVRPISGSACLGNGLGSTAAALVDKLLYNTGVNTATCPLQEIYAALEEGTYDPTTLSPAGAAELLKCVMLAGDYELLTMLVHSGIGECCSQPCLQLLVEYAQLEGLPWFAELVVRQTKVELTTQLLTWLVQELLTSGVAADLEQLLAVYCMERRNPLSSVAAVERVLVKVAVSGSIHQQEAATALSVRFHGAKHSLLHQLFRQSAEHHHAAALDAASQEAQDTDTGSSNPATQDHNQMLQKPLLELLHLSFDEKGGKAIGRGSHAGSSSIHDSSPYAAAVRLADADFLSLPPVVEYTERVWRGTELHTMLGLLLPNGDVSKSKSSLRKFRAAVMPARAAIVFKQQAEPSADLAGSGLHISRCSLKLSSSIDSVGDARCYLGMPGATMVPGAANSMTATACVENDQPQQHGVSGPCAEGVECSDVSQARISDLGSSSCKDTIASSHQQSMLSSHAGADNDSRPIAASRHAAISSVCWLDPCVGLDLLHNMGLAGEGQQLLARVASRAMHAALLAPRAFHNSARGRWLKRCLFELLFLVWYQTSIQGVMPTSAILLVLPAVVIGNLVDALFQLHYKFKDRFMVELLFSVPPTAVLTLTCSVGVYLSDHSVQLNLLVNLGLLAIFIWTSVSLASPLQKSAVGALVQDTDVNLPDQQKLSDILIVASAFAVFVWVRALGIVIPASARLGAMLVTVRRAAAEAAAMVPLILVLLIGFATSLTVVYQHVATPEYSTLFGAMQMLVSATGGDLDLLWFVRAAECNHFLEVWGQVLMTCYVVVVNILIMTLLIAVINYSYHPVIISQETVVMHAQTVQHYDWQCRHGIAGSPTNVVQLLLLWLPHGFRKRADPTTCLKWWTPPLDGYVPADATGAPELLIATGPAEAGYLAFLMTLYPMMSVIAVVALLLHTPFAVLHFAVTGHTMWLGSSLGPSMENGQGDPANNNSNSNNDDSSSPNHNNNARRKSVVLNRRASLVLGPRAAPYMAAGAVSRRWPLSSGGGSGLVPVHHPGSRWRWLSNNCLVGPLQTIWSVLEEPLAKCLRVVLAAVIGLLVQLVLILVLTLALLWAWVTRVLFCIYCMLAPSAANVSCSMHLVRHASFWSKADVQAAFLAADSVSSQLQAAAATARQSGGGHYKRQKTGSYANLAMAGHGWSNNGAEAASQQADKRGSFDSASQRSVQEPVAGTLVGPFESTGTLSYLAVPPLGPVSAAMPEGMVPACTQQRTAGPDSTPRTSGVWCSADNATAGQVGLGAADNAGQLMQGANSFPDTSETATAEPLAAMGDGDRMMAALAALSLGMSNDEAERQSAVSARPELSSGLPGSTEGGPLKWDTAARTTVQKNTSRSAAALLPLIES